VQIVRLLLIRNAISTAISQVYWSHPAVDLPRRSSSTFLCQCIYASTPQHVNIFITQTQSKQHVNNISTHNFGTGTDEYHKDQI